MTNAKRIASEMADCAEKIYTRIGADRIHGATELICDLDVLERQIADLRAATGIAHPRRNQ